MQLKVKDKETGIILETHFDVEKIEGFRYREYVIAFLSDGDTLVLRKSNDTGNQEYVYELEV